MPCSKELKTEHHLGAGHGLVSDIEDVIFAVFDKDTPLNSRGELFSGSFRRKQLIRGDLSVTRRHSELMGIVAAVDEASGCGPDRSRCESGRSPQRSCSSVVEHRICNAGVAGSIPCQEHQIAG